MVKAVQGIAAGILVAFLLGVAFAAAALMAFDEDLRAEERRAVLVLVAEYVGGDVDTTEMNDEESDVHQD